MKIAIPLITATILLFSACSKKTSETPEPENDFTKITMEQFQEGKMALGKPLKMAFENSFQISGKIVSRVDGLAKISIPIEGFIKRIHVRKGQSVKSGEVLFEIEGSALIELQKAFAISSAKMPQLQSDFERIEQLFKENIKTESEFMIAESAYKTELANYSALKQNLENIHLSISDIENGNYASVYQIKSPIQGQVVDVQTTPGQYVSPQSSIAEIVDARKKHLQLLVFENDYSKIKSGQKVAFKTASEKGAYSTATITSIGKILNMQSKSFDCFAEISDTDKSKFIINQLVHGQVILNTDTVFALPQEAILKSGNNQFVFVKAREIGNELFLEKVKVRVGRSSKNHVELIDGPLNKQILISGAYHISSE